MARTIEGLLDKIHTTPPAKPWRAAKSLAEEADLKRWVLTHKYQDLQGEFRTRVKRHGREPEPAPRPGAPADKSPTPTGAESRTNLTSHHPSHFHRQGPASAKHLRQHHR